MATIGTRRYGGDGVMEYRQTSTGLYVPVSGAPSAGQTPTYQADGSVAWATPGAAPGGGGAGAETLIQELVLSAAAASIDFTGIPQTYRDLRLVLRGRGDAAGTTYCRPRLRMNGDTGTNYDWTRHQGHLGTQEGEGVVGGAFIDVGLLPGGAGPANYPGATELRLFDYRGSSYKMLLYAAGSTAVGQLYILNGAGWWRSTAAVTSLTLLLDAGFYVAGSVVSLYGVL